MFQDSHTPMLTHVLGLVTEKSQCLLKVRMKEVI